MAGIVEKPSVDNSAVEDCARAGAQSALARSPIYALRRLCVAQTDESLVLSGTVGSFYEKQQAQEVVRSLAGPLEVINQIAVSDF